MLQRDIQESGMIFHMDRVINLVDLNQERLANYL